MPVVAASDAGVHVQAMMVKMLYALVAPHAVLCVFVNQYVAYGAHRLRRVGRLEGDK